MVQKHINNIKKIEKRMHDDPQFHKENPLALLSFIELFYYFMNTKYPGQKDSYIYNKAHINAKLFSKMRNPNYHASRKTIIALGLALELNIDEFEILLSSANYAFSLNNTFDIAIIYCIEHRIYDIFEVNEIIYELGL